MGKLIVSAWMTLDGFVARPDDNMDWLRPDQDLMDYETTLVHDAGSLLLGRVTHSDFASYWPAVARGDIEGDEGNRRYARRLDALEKIVVSRSGQVATWERSRRVDGVTVEEMQRIKGEASGNVVVYGSLSVVEVLDQLGLLDEVHLVVHPVFLGQGKPLFPRGCQARLDLLENRTFSSGAVLLRYRCSYHSPSTS